MTLGTRLDSRNGARIETEFLARIEGVDGYPVLRRGNISATGVYFDVEGLVGAPGSVQWLTVGSADGLATVDTLARVIRVVTMDDVRQGHVTGVAFQFMPEKHETRDAIERVVERIIAMQLDQEIQIFEGEDTIPERDSSAKSTPSPRDLSGQRTLVQRVGVHRILLDTNWSANIGEHVAVAIQTDHETKMRFAGEVIEVGKHAKDDPYPFRVELRLNDPDEDTSEVSRVVGMMFSDLLGEPSPAAPQASHEHLIGSMARIKITSLLALFEMEHISGILRVHSAMKHSTLYVSEGRLVDIESDPVYDSPKHAIGDIMNWLEGEFEFTMEDIDRPDTIGMSTTALLLDVAREMDEADRRDTHPL